MSKVSFKTSKIIWALSRNQCAICKKKLTKKIKKQHLVLGQECHIRSDKENGPRFDPSYPVEKLNLPDNLILLCRDHHKIIDDLPEKYPIEKLEKIKLDHESQRVRSINKNNDSPKVIQSTKYLAAIQIITGMQLINAVAGYHAYSASFDETDDEELYKLIKEFLVCLKDLDALIDVSEGLKLDIAREIKRLIAKLNSHGYYVYCATVLDKLRMNGKDTPWKTFYCVLSSNPSIKYLIR
ncbi:hypothetical protein GYA49_04510 [Candidatus Beckwithbacteria bacterium]|nr:hypothetical protein [Candidatus Beckwithbacteria bacterium]